MHRKYVVITGGVLSGLGKGVAIASIGHLLSSTYKVVPIKCDGYLNVDPGTMNPTEHGEVFVLDDGGEVDMDFGHYERFLGIPCKSNWNLTMGKVFNEILQKERRGDFLGHNVQLIPDVSNHITEHYLKIGEETNADIVLIEVGGTVGDMENELFIEAVRNLVRKVGRENVMFVHLAYVPIPPGVNEQKSKPTQQSIQMLNQRGIEPDMVIARCSEMLTENVKNKIAISCNLTPDEIITGVDVDNIYKIPLVFEEQGICKIISKKLNIIVNPNLEKLKTLINNLENANKEITIAIAGKYTALEDAYASIIEALNHCSAHFSTKINVKWIETSNGNLDLSGIDGVIVPGGFGSRGIEGKIQIIKYCRENKIPFLGICLGLQMAVVEFARNICGLEAHSTEIDPYCKEPVINIMEEQKEISDKGGTMRLGSYPANVRENSLIHDLYNQTNVSERHRHRFEVNPKYHQILENNGLILSGKSPDGTLVEFIELPKEKHPYFTATQGHPELKSSLHKPAPLFLGLIGAALKFSQNKLKPNNSFDYSKNYQNNTEEISKQENNFNEKPKDIYSFENPKTEEAAKQEPNLDEELEKDYYQYLSDPTY